MGVRVNGAFHLSPSHGIGAGLSHILILGDDMNKTDRKTYAFWILLAEATGALSAYLSMEGMARYAQIAVKPPLTPPGWVFGVAWTILYALMGISAARVYTAPMSQDRSRGLNLFIAELIINFFWSLIFFNAQAYGLALIWLLILWALVFLMILQFRLVDRTAGSLQIPYLLWLTFATYLNWGVWRLNM